MHSLKLLAAASALALTAALPASAITIDSITGSWQNAVSEGDVSGLGTPSIRFGRSIEGAPRSAFQFDSVAPPSKDVEADTPFRLGDFIHKNLPVYTPVMTSADLLLEMTLSDGQRVRSLYTFGLDETVNTLQDCPYGGANWSGVNANGCADRVTFTLQQGESTPLTIGGEDYLLNLTGFRYDGETVDSFVTAEQQDNVAGLYGEFERVAAVPLPASGLLLLGGLGAAAAIRRKRAAA